MKTRDTEKGETSTHGDDSISTSRQLNPRQRFTRYTTLTLVICSIAAFVGLALRPRRPPTEDPDVLVPPAPAPQTTADSSLAELLQQRSKMDQQVWADEVTAQAFERPITNLWDALNRADDKWATATSFSFQTLHIPAAQKHRQLSHSIRQFKFKGPTSAYDHGQFTQLIDGFRRNGLRIVETEWHHSRFIPADNAGPRSEVTFAIHVDSPKRDVDRRYILRGTLAIEWSKSSTGTEPVRANSMRLVDGELLMREGPPAFRKVLTYSRRPDDYASAHPIILQDLDRNGYDDIIISRWNRIYWNSGSGAFREGRLLQHFVPHWETGIVADFTTDGFADFVTVDKQGRCVLFAGTSDGTFPAPPRFCAKIGLTFPSAMTAGDIDADGDLDLWIAQYRMSYEDGQMPTPYYDANDGYAAVLLENDGAGSFVDVTSQAGLTEKRHRRTYSSSLVDLDSDGDLDLMVVSDYAGIDLYLNNGSGRFTDVTDRLADRRHLFGMAHTLADFDLDDHLDMYVIGMSSTTARRLDRMNLGRLDRPDVHRMRSAMGYGNRMYLASTPEFPQPAFATSVARTGWSWGTTSFDFDLDADPDVYVANGFRSGRSTQDYCTRFWCHDIYTGDSNPSPVIESLLHESLSDLDQRNISWNGYEHNVLLMNLDGQDFVNIGFLMGVSFEYDSRAVLSNDLDGDGRPDLLVAEYSFADKGFVLDLHVYQNILETSNHWIGLRMPGSVEGRWPTGATVSLRAGDRWRSVPIVTGDSFLSQHANTVQFGLGDAATVDQLQVRWPDGTALNIDAPEIDRAEPWSY